MFLLISGRKDYLINEKSITQFKLNLSQTDWNDILCKNKNVNEIYTEFADRMQSLLNKTIPKKRVKIKNNKKKPYLTVGLKKSCEHKRLLKIFIEKTDNEFLKSHYKRYEKILKKCVKLSKKHNHIKEMKRSQNKCKTMWNIIKNNFKPDYKCHNKNVTLRYDDNKTTSAPSAVANIFNALRSANRCQTTRQIHAQSLNHQ